VSVRNHKVFVIPAIRARQRGQLLKRMVIKRAAGMDTQEEVRYLPYERGSYRLQVHGMDFFIAISRAGKRISPPALWITVSE
jgi:hypothetical protein